MHHFNVIHLGKGCLAMPSAQICPETFLVLPYVGCLG